VTKTLESLGLSHLEAQVYVFLGKRGPQKAKDIKGALKIPKQQLYLVLKTLQGRSIVCATIEHPAKFSAVSFEKVLDLFVKAKTKELQRIQEDQPQILSDWQSIAIRESPGKSANFTVVQGRNQVYSRFKQMIEQTEDQLLIIATVAGLARADQFGIFGVQFKNAPNSKIRIRFLTEISQQNARIMKDLLRRPQRDAFEFEGRVPNWERQFSTRLVIRDQEEALFFISPEDDKTSQGDSACLWTDCKSLVEAFTTVFEDFWRDANPIGEEIAQFEAGPPVTPPMIAGANAKTRKAEVPNFDQQEIFLLTSSEGLIDLSKRIMLLEEWSRRGISVKIMAPLTNQNLRVARLLSECCEIKNVPSSWLDGSVVGGKHLFQFKNPPSSREKTERMAFFDDPLGIVDAEDEEKAKSLDKLWAKI
jgi:sugar-specific transcriptional regulator TrmB